MMAADVVASLVLAGAFAAWWVLYVVPSFQMLDDWRRRNDAWLEELAKRDGITPEEMRKKLGLRPR